MPLRHALLILAVGLILTACAEFPVLDAAVTPEAARAPYPQIVPLGALLDQAAIAQISPDTQATLAARAEALKRKATSLRATP